MNPTVPPCHPLRALSAIRSAPPVFGLALLIATLLSQGTAAVSDTAASPEAPQRALAPWVVVW